MIELSMGHLVVALRGNHEAMILAARADETQANLLAFLRWG
jgi:hypothetical protein